MKAFLIFFTIFLFFCAFYSAKGQFSEHFDDGNFTNAPGWHGDSSSFEIASGMLHLKARPEKGEAMLTTPSQTVRGARWTFEVRMDFNPSSQNYVDVYIVSDSKNLHKPLNGYFVRIGYTGDNVSLYRQSGDKNSVRKIIEGSENRIDGSSVRLNVSVSCDDTGRWELFSDPDLTGNFISEGTATDQNFAGSQYFGLLCKYTSTRADKFYFDNFTVTGPLPTDTIPPVADTIRQISSNSLKIYFSEPVINYPAGVADNYHIDLNGSLWSQAISTQIIENTALVSFEKEFERNKNYELNIEKLADNCLNITHSQTCSFISRDFSPANYRDIVINEIMADPYPVRGLSGDEYVELYNPSEKTINLAGWKLAGAGNDLLTDYLLPPGGFVILTATGSVSHFEGPVLSWGNSGTLRNEGEWLFLLDPSGHSIDSLKYDISWYMDPSRKNGGWSLEQINPYATCSGPDNWRASADTTGGTPGTINAVFAIISDSIPPLLTSIRTIDSMTVLLTFSEMPFNSRTSCFHLTSGPSVDTVITGPEYNQLKIRCVSPFNEGKDYTLELKNITDCAGNEMRPVTGTFRFDKTPPRVLSVIAITENKIRVRFDEKIDAKSARHTSNYIITPGETQPQDVKMAGENSVYLTFHKPFNKSVYTITCRGILDLNGNKLENEIFPFEFHLPPQPDFNDVVISEIMADPTPVRGLPPCEYLELHNVSDHEILMGDAILMVGRNPRIITELYLEKGAYGLLCASSSKHYFEPGLSVISLSNWPAIKNHGDTLSLYRNDGKLIFAMAYDQSSYESLKKKEGGWSLEMIDVTRGCAGKDNWKASIDPSGGTPGRANSVRWLKPDMKGPDLLEAGAPDPFTVILKFSERLHPEKTDDLIIETKPALNISGKQLIMPLGDKVRLTLNDKLGPGTIYQVQIDNAIDCCGNINGKTNRTATFILPAIPEAGDILINEILFQPRQGGVEFVELYNRSEKSFDLKNLSIAVEKNGNYIRNKALCPEMHIYQPGTFLVLTKDPSVLKGDYPAGDAETFLQMPLPQLNNEEGTIVLLRNDGVIIDRVYYSRRFHHPMIADPAGVSLERISFVPQKGDEKLWHSAASSAGFATPGKMNSQYMSEGIAGEYISIEPRVIAPNVTGLKDFATISFSFTEYGMMGTIEVYDILGRRIKTIAKNELLAIGGSYIWRGDDDTGRGVRAGQYILRFELYNAEGRHQVIKKTIAVGRNF